MSHEIWKYELALVDEQSISVPIDFQPLSVGVQGGALMLWGRVTPGHVRAPRRVWVIGTGNPMPKAALSALFVGTAQMPLPPYGSMVWHVFIEDAP